MINSEMSVIRFMGVAKLSDINRRSPLSSNTNIQPDRFPPGFAQRSFFARGECFGLPGLEAQNASEIEAKVSPEVITGFSGVSNKLPIK